MNRTILVPIDISDSELTQRVISHVEAEAKIDDAEVHFLTVIPSLPYYASLGLAYSAELPAMDDLKAEAKSQLEPKGLNSNPFGSNFSFYYNFLMNTLTAIHSLYE